MNIKSNDSPAFPTPVVTVIAGAVIDYVKPGMTLRDAFAIAALIGLCTKVGTTMVCGAGQNDCVNLAAASFAYADAMLKARISKPQ